MGSAKRGFVSAFIRFKSVENHGLKCFIYFNCYNGRAYLFKCNATGYGMKAEGCLFVYNLINSEIITGLQIYFTIDFVTLP